jgi:hypothetical protein
MEWVASALHTTSEHGVSSITTADAHTSAASSRLNWRPRRFKWTRPFRRKTKSGFCACHHISNAVYHCTTAPLMRLDLTLRSFSKAKLVEVACLKSLGCMGRMVKYTLRILYSKMLHRDTHERRDNKLLWEFRDTLAWWNITLSVTGFRNCVCLWWRFKDLNDRPLLLFEWILPKHLHCVVLRVPVCCN